MCPVCGDQLERKVCVGLVEMHCQKKHYKRKMHISDIESKLYVGLAGKAA